MKASLFLLSSIFILQSGTTYAHGTFTEEEIAEEYYQTSLQRNREQNGLNFYGLFAPFNQCKYAVKTPDKVTRGTIALTFDDGPNLAVTPKILDVLKSHRAQATFFVQGENIKGKEALVRRILDEGHILASHSQTHKNYHKMGTEQKQNEVTAAHKALLKFTQPRFFRYPYGNSSCESNTFIENMGYSITGWNIDTCDWAFADGYVDDKENVTCQAPASLRNDYLGYVRAQVAKTQGGIMLMHDTHHNTADKLHSLLTMLEQSGYRFVTLDDVNIFPLLNKK